MRDVLKKEGKALLLGNEAIVRGAIEAGVNFASTYPGTPSSEIGDTFCKVSKELKEIYFEYSTNEKTALEASIGASFAELKSIVAMKHFGLNVALDSFLPSVYVSAPYVLAVTDDPSCWSSLQEEEDSRYISLLANVPLIEPSDSQECKDFTKTAFEVADKFKTPVLLRATTRVCHSTGIVELGKINLEKKQGHFTKNEARFNTLAPKIIDIHKQILEKLEKIREFSENSHLNKTFNDKASEIAIIVSGVSFNYVMEILKDNNLSIPVLKLGITYPLPEKKIISFLKNKKNALIIEELEPFVENAVRVITQKHKISTEIFGKDYLPRQGEFNQNIIENSLQKLSKDKDLKLNIKISKGDCEIAKQIPRRFPVLCPGCPHRGSFYAVKSAVPDAIFAGDIGCYLLGIYPPLKTLDFILDMGAGIGIAHGLKKSTNQKVVAFIGDSTFFHSGISGLINMIFNKSNALVVILDNRITAMTGHQPDAGSVIDIESLVKTLGIKNVKTIDAYNIQEIKKTAKQFSDSNQLSVIIAKRECIFLKPKPNLIYEITEDCKKCGACLKIGCPAIERVNNRYRIDKGLCYGCSICSQVCPNKAIKPAKLKK